MKQDRSRRRYAFFRQNRTMWIVSGCMQYTIKLFLKDLSVCCVLVMLPPDVTLVNSVLQKAARVVQIYSGIYPVLSDSVFWTCT